MNAEQYAEEFPAQHYNTDIQAICEMLRRLAAVESDCAPYLKEGETPAERIKRALGDADSLMSLYRDVVAERDALKEQMRDVAMLLLDNDRSGLKKWATGLVLCESGGEWSVSTVVAEQQKEIDALKAENERLTNCLKKANDQAEDFERRWYLADMELERIKALPPEAVRYDFDGYGWQYIDNGSGSDWLTRHKDGEPLYALGSKT